MPSPKNESSRRVLPLGAVRRRAERHRADGARQISDAVAEEVPVAFIYNERPHAVMMASPSNLDDFALGFSLSEAIISDAAECERIEVQPALAGIELRITIPSGRATKLEDRARELTGRTGCGLCGAQTLEAAVRHPAPVPGDVRISETALKRALGALDELQTVNAATGAVHAAAWAQPDGHIALLREDVGRHNALDKLIGAMNAAGVDEGEGFALITSRASFEMVMKAATVGIAAMAAISAPTALAISLAQEANVLLIGFARQYGYSVYTFPQRVDTDAPVTPSKVAS